MITQTSVKNPTFRAAIMQATYKSLQSMKRQNKAKAVKVYNRRNKPVLQVIVDFKGRAHVYCLHSCKFITETVGAGLCHA